MSYWTEDDYLRGEAARMRQLHYDQLASLKNAALAQGIGSFANQQAIPEPKPKEDKKVLLLSKL